jgi:hypothetical protein
MRRVAVAVCLAWALPALANDVLVLSFGGTAEDAEGGAWLPARLADLVGAKLTLLGVDARDRRFDTREKIAALISGNVEPNAPFDPGAAITIELDLQISGQKPQKKKLNGRAGDVEKLAAAIAVQTAEALGQKISPAVKARASEETYPLAVQRFLGLARAHFDAGNHRKAMVMYDRAAELVKIGALPEAIEGKLIAEGELLARGEATFGARADLAPPAAVRAEVALRKGDDKEAARAFEGYLRATPDRALRFSVQTPLEKTSTTLLAQGATWILQSGENELKRLRIEPRTGSILSREPGLRGLISIVGGDALVLEQKTISRLDQNGKAKWKLALPVTPRGPAKAAVEVSSGVAGVLAEHDVVWVETSFGELGQRAKGVRPITSGAAGVLVETKPGELALLRPGKKTAAWTANVAEVLDAALTGDRVLLVGRTELHFLRTHDGKEAGRAIALPTPAARIAGADGRYAVIDLGEGGAMLVDVLGAEQTAILKGPGAPIASYTASNGVALAFATGDLIFYERDGRVLDRAKVPGKIIDLVPGNPLVPGPVAVTTRGLYAYAEVPSERRMRDVDAMLELAVVLARMGEKKAALRLAEHVAARSAGRIDRAETMRAELLTDPEAAALARARAEAAKDPTRALPPFSP